MVRKATELSLTIILATAPGWDHAQGEIRRTCTMSSVFVAGEPVPWLHPAGLSG